MDVAEWSNSLCAAVFAATLVIVLTAPRQYIAPTFVCGLAAHLVRTLTMTAGVGVNWATVAAAAAAVLVAFVVTPKHLLESVVILSAILPLSAAVSLFEAILNLVRVPQLQGTALTQASIKLNANLGTAFTTTLALVLGLQIGIGIVLALGHKRQV